MTDDAVPYFFMSSGEIDNLVRADFAAAMRHLRAKCSAKGELRKLPKDSWKAEAVKLIIKDTSGNGVESGSDWLQVPFVPRRIDWQYLWGFPYQENHQHSVALMFLCQ
jgi:hypothetical protein